MDNKGNISVLALFILAAISIYLSLMLHSAVSIRAFTKSHEEFIIQNHHYRSALTRVISYLQKDILASGPFQFDDLGQEIALEEISREEEETYIREVTGEDEELEIPFEVLMDTTIHIYFNGGEFGYIRLFDPSGELVFVGGDGRWEIDSSQWEYGDYTLIMSGYVTVFYTQVIERVVEADSHILKIKLSRGHNKIFLEK